MLHIFPDNNTLTFSGVVDMQAIPFGDTQLSVNLPLYFHSTIRNKIDLEFSSYERISASQVLGTVTFGKDFVFNARMEPLQTLKNASNRCIFLSTNGSKTVRDLAKSAEHLNLMPAEVHFKKKFLISL